MSEPLEQRVAALEAGILALERRSMHEPSAPWGKTSPSPREFLLNKAPKSDSDKTLAAGYYIEIISGKDSFNFDDIEVFYGQAKEAAPANRRDPPYQNVTSGYFRKVGKRQVGGKARNTWAMTNLGIGRVERGFKKDM